MTTFELICDAILARKVLVSEHAYDEAVNDALNILDVIAAIPAGEVIEDYPDDPRGSSCLVLVQIEPDTQPVHAVLGYDAQTDRAIVITVYRPDPGRWSNDFRVRRRKS